MLEDLVSFYANQQEGGNIMSIASNKKDLKEALKKAYKKYPRKEEYPIKVKECIHDHSLEIYNDGKYKICRCNTCGDEQVFPVEKKGKAKDKTKKEKTKDKNEKNKDKKK